MALDWCATADFKYSALYSQKKYSLRLSVSVFHKNNIAISTSLPAPGFAENDNHFPL